MVVKEQVLNYGGDDDTQTPGYYYNQARMPENVDGGGEQPGPEIHLRQSRKNPESNAAPPRRGSPANPCCPGGLLTIL